MLLFGRGLLDRLLPSCGGLSTSCRDLRLSLSSLSSLEFLYGERLRSCLNHLRPDQVLIPAIALTLGTFLDGERDRERCLYLGDGIGRDASKSERK